MSKARKFAVEAFAESLLPVMRQPGGRHGHPENATPEQLLEGVHATLRQLTQALERNKVVAIAPPPAPSSTRTSTRPSAWCRPSRTPTPWWPCCRRAT
jgi:hypothetical protein